MIFFAHLISVISEITDRKLVAAMNVTNQVETLPFQANVKTRRIIKQGGAAAKPRLYDLGNYMRPEDWRRLPPAIQKRFGAHEDPPQTDYYGNMEIVRRSFLGFCLAHLSRPLGAPVPPFAGKNVPTIVRLYETPAKDGIVWERRYAFSNNRATTIKSIKLYTDTEGLLEWVGGGLGMYLDVFEQDQKLHFVSQSYFWRKGPITIPLPAWLSPGRTHVIHTDEGNGWFRFTMSIIHPLFGELYFQDGLFKDEE